MSPLGPSEINAKRRPFVVLGIAALRLGLGFCLAWPLAALVETSGLGLRAEGDRLLFEGGGFFLLEVLRLKGPALAAVIRGLLPLFVLGLLLTAASNAALFIALNVRERLALRPWLSQALARLPGFVLVGLGTRLAQVVVFAAGALVVEAIPEPATKPVAVTAAQLGAWLVVASLAGAIGGFSDVVKANLVRHGAPIVRAFSQTLHCLRQKPLRVSFGWLPFAAGLLLLVAGGSQLSELLDVSRAGAWRISLVFAGHQLIVLVSVALRSAWYARALRVSATSAA